MALLETLTNDQLTDIRSGTYQILQFVCTVPNTVVVKFQPSAAPSTDVFAEIAVGSVTTGSMSNIMEGQLVIFSTGSDYQATEFFRSRVRKVSGSSTLYVSENSQTLTTSHYVTVIDTYEIVERLRRDTENLDWDITFRKLRPIETALKAAYVLSNDVTSFTPTAAPRWMDADASSIASHSWSSSNSSDVLNSGGTIASPNFTLQAGAFRWIRYTFTDNLGLSNYRVIPVWTVPRNYSSVVQLGFGAESGELANINFDPELGWTCGIVAFSGITALLNRTLTVIACDEWYGGRTNADRQNIRTNINFIGYLQNESVDTRADEGAGQISEAQFTIESFGHQLARQNIAPITVIQKATSAAAWDEIQDPTPGRMLSLRLTEYSTASTLMPIRLPDDDDDFVGDDLTLSTEKALDDLNVIAAGYNAEIQFDLDGLLDLCRDLNYRDDTTRDAADVVATLSPADFVNNFTIDFEYGYTTSQVTVTGGDYTTSLDRYDLTEALAPAVARYSEGDPFELSNQVLTTDATQTEANTELGQRASNFLAANNPTWILRARVKAEWRSVMIPDVGTWWQHDIAYTDTVRGRSFGVNDRWQLVQVSSVTNNLTGDSELDCVWRHETRSTGASVRAAPIVNDPDADIDYVPAVLAPFTGGDLSLTDGNWYDSQDPTPPSDPNPVPSECELVGFRITNPAGAQTVASALNGEQVSIQARGFGQITEGTVYDFTVSDQSFSAVPQSGSGTPQGSHSASGWDDADTVDTFGNGHRGVDIERTGLSLGTVTSVLVTFDYTKGSPESPTSTAGYIVLNGGAPQATRTFNGFTNGTDLTWLWTGSVGSVTSVEVRIDADVDIGNNRPGGMSGTVTIKSIVINDQTVYGDACYYWTGSLESPEGVTPYDAGEGLQIESGDPSAIPPYNPEHEYQFFEIVTSGPVLLTFESPYPSDGATSWSISAIVCFLGVP